MGNDYMSKSAVHAFHRKQLALARYLLVLDVLFVVCCCDPRVREKGDRKRAIVSRTEQRQKQDCVAINVILTIGVFCGVRVHVCDRSKSSTDVVAAVAAFLREHANDSVEEIGEAAFSFLGEADASMFGAE